jgi:DNA polymerase kappa
VSTETTFSEIGDKEELRAKLRWAAEEMEKDLARTQFKGRTLCLKVKLHTFEVLTRQTAPPRAVSQAKELYAFALPMLSKLEKDIPGMKLRLLGLRCSNLVSTKKVGINFFGAAAQPKPSSVQTLEAPVQKDDHEIGPEEAFESSARQEVQDEMNDLEQLSQETANLPDTARPSDAGDPVESQPTQWECPICGRPQVADDRVFNDHVDFCLSRQTIREVVEDTSQEEPSVTATRKRKPSQPSTTESDPRQKRLFFQ